MSRISEIKKAVNARIYNESRACTQSGRGKQDVYVLEFFCPESKYKEPLMGWNASCTTLEEVKIKFPSLEAAKNFAQKNGLQYEVLLSNGAKFVPKRYSDNFR